jgi:hypothetical protein
VHITTAHSPGNLGSIKDMCEEPSPMNQIQSLSFSARVFVFAFVVALAIGALTAAATIV